MIGISFDAINQNVWFHSTKKLYCLSVEDEDSDLWRAYLKVNLGEALRLCLDTPHYPFVCGLYADQLFENGSLKKAVDFYSKSNKSFEEVTLKFLNINSYGYLQEYLIEFLRKTKKVVENSGDETKYR